ncbi:hypothetical protein [Luteolibacter sp. Populi]|uniref:hypothetical protein n=1 Tax=Luteolibacter sp. Populi TaxID=3230487 RepID=UPI0034653542
MNFRGTAILLLVTACTGWLGYRAGIGPDQAEAMWAARDRPAATRQGLSKGGDRASARKSATALLQDFKARDPGCNNPLVQLEGWESVRAFTAEQCLEGLKVTGEEMDPTSRTPWAGMLYFRWAELDPDAAMERALRLPEGHNHDFAQSVLSAWFKNDPEAAYRWCKSEPKRAERLSGSNMMGAMLLSEPSQSAMAKATLLDKMTRYRVFGDAGTLAGRDTPEARQAFLQSLGKYGDEDRQLALKALLRSWGASEAREVLERWDEFGYHDPNPSFPEKDSILRRWGSREPEQALAWTEEIPQAAGQPQQLDIYKRWVDSDPEAAARWLEGRDNAGEYAALLVKQFHSATLKGTVSRSATQQVRQSREEAQRRHYQLWARQQPQAAAEWLNGIDTASATKIKGGEDATH